MPRFHCRVRNGSVRKGHEFGEECSWLDADEEDEIVLETFPKLKSWNGKRQWVYRLHLSSLSRLMDVGTTRR
ncbi:unnamed protein product [Boreogadus saida]